MHRGRAEDFVVVEPHADVAVVRGSETTLVDSIADLADGFLEFLDVLHYYLSTISILNHEEHKGHEARHEVWYFLGDLSVLRGSIH